MAFLIPAENAVLVKLRVSGLDRDKVLSAPQDEEHKASFLEDSPSFHDVFPSLSLAAVLITAPMGSTGPREWWLSEQAQT